MEIDATTVTSGTTIEAQICIIGSGPAGLVLAAELCRKGCDVLLLESGAHATDAATVRERAQELNVGSCEGDAYAGLTATRYRSVGGTTALWNTSTHLGPGAKYVPLDPWDFEMRWSDADAQWQHPYDVLHTYYKRAYALCGLSLENGDSAHDFRDTAPIPATDDVKSSRYHMGARDSLINPLLAVLRAAPNARIMTHATVVALHSHPTHAVARVASETGTFDVRAKRVVLAGGAIENARLLLVAGEQGGVPKDESGWLGRGFMEHPRDRSITLHPQNAAQFRALSFYDTQTSVDLDRARHSMTLGRLALDGDVIRKEQLINASATLLPNVQSQRDRIREVMVRRTGFRGLKRWLPESGHGWSTHPAPHRVFDGFTVLLNLEQPPHQENAITLSSKRDRFDVPIPALHWRWHDEDQMRLQRVRALFAKALEGAGVGRVTVSENPRPDPNAHHHAGTTRMHIDAKRGVVDADGRVFGTETLFVAGASTFPTAGFANPTLTIVAMSLRLADRLHDDL